MVTVTGKGPYQKHNSLWQHVGDICWWCWILRADCRSVLKDNLLTLAWIRLECIKDKMKLIWMHHHTPSSMAVRQACEEGKVLPKSKHNDDLYVHIHVSLAVQRSSPVSHSRESQYRCKMNVQIHGKLIDVFPPITLSMLCSIKFCWFLFYGVEKPTLLSRHGDSNCPAFMLPVRASGCLFEFEESGNRAKALSNSLHGEYEGTTWNDWSLGLENLGW